jgi:peptidoglycan/LPS O-acetylase OafA/YrhL
LAHRDNNFELLRLFAALQVLLIHGNEHLRIHVPQLIRTLLSIFPSVSNFFVISGYLIAGSLLRSSNLPSYALNRFLRISPAL